MWLKFLKFWGARIFELTKVLIVLTMIGYLIHIFVATVFVVDGESMMPNLLDKEYLMVNRIHYDVSTPKRGDIVIFYYPGEPSKKFIKRIIGLPGEKVEIANGQVYINDQKLDEPYMSSDTVTPTETDQDQIIYNVEPGSFFVLGDNRTNSSDSRIWGSLPRKFIIGQAEVALFPIQLWQHFGTIDYPTQTAMTK